VSRKWDRFNNWDEMREATRSNIQKRDTVGRVGGAIFKTCGCEIITSIPTRVYFCDYHEGFDDAYDEGFADGVEDERSPR
jgi:hypothetical protein